MSSLILLLAVFVGTLIVLYLSGMPVAFAMGLTSLLIMASPLGGGLNFSVISQRMLFGLNSFPLLAVPFYVLLGRLMNRIGMTHRIFRFARSLFGQFRGGIAYVNIVASMIFAGMSGLAVADAAGLGRIEYEAMREEGYDQDISIGVTGSSAVIGPLLPPSVTVIIYAVLASESIGKLFIGGIVPGILMGVALMIFTFFVIRSRGYEATQTFEFDELWTSFRKSLLALLTPVILIGGILSGVFTATEAGAIANIYIILVGIFAYSELDIDDLWQELQESMVETTSLMIIVAMASIYGLVAIQLRLPMLLAESIMAFTTDPTVILLLFVALFLIVGTFMSTAAAILVIVPVILPILRLTNIGTLHFGIVLLLALLIGTLTPPFGVLLFVLEKVTDASLEKVFRSVLPYYIPIFAILLLVVFIPELVTFLPNYFL